MSLIMASTGFGRKLVRIVVGSPPPGGYDPITDLFGSSENGFFWDAQDLTTLWQDTGGSTQADAVNDPVQRIDDLSPNGKNGSRISNEGSLKQDGNGKYYIDTNASALAFQFSRMTDIRSVCAVVDIDTLIDYQALLGDGTDFQFHGDTGGFIISSSFAAAHVKSGAWSLNGTAINPTTTAYPTSLGILICITTANAIAENVTQDRSFGREMKGKIYGYAVSNAPWTAVQQANLVNYWRSRVGLPFQLSHLFSGGKAGYAFDYRDLSTLFKDSARTDPCTAAGDALNGANDLSGNNNNIGWTSGVVIGGTPGNYYADLDGTDFIQLPNATPATAYFLIILETADTNAVIVQNSGSIYFAVTTSGSGLALYENVGTPTFVINETTVTTRGELYTELNTGAQPKLLHVSSVTGGPQLKIGGYAGGLELTGKILGFICRGVEFTASEIASVQTLFSAS